MIGLIILGIIAVIVIWTIFANIKIVSQSTVLVIEYLGKFNRIMQAGFSLKTPFFERVVAEVSLRQQNLGTKDNFITQDKVGIEVSTNLIYSVISSLEGIKNYVYALTEREDSVSAIIENSLRSYIAKETHEGILQKKDELAAHIKTDLTEQFTNWGMFINSFQITTILFPQTITDAMSQVVASQQLMNAASNQGEVIKIKAVKQAEAEKETKRLNGEGIAQERAAIAEGLKESIATLTEATGQDAKQVLALLTLTQYLDTIKSVGASDNSKVIFMDTGINKTTDLMQQIMGSMESK